MLIVREQDELGILKKLIGLPELGKDLVWEVQCYYRHKVWEVSLTMFICFIWNSKIIELVHLNGIQRNFTRCSNWIA